VTFELAKPDLFPDKFRALVIGASGSIGAGFVAHLDADRKCGGVVALHRGSTPAIDFENAQAATALANQAPFDLIIHAAGLLHDEQFMPEKKLSDLNYEQMTRTFRINTLGPALCIRHFSKLLSRGHCVMAILSAKVGSIEDNRLGGWYSYRASKAALNMVVKTAAIELARSRPQAVLISLHPGTVSSKLSRPFRGEEIGRSPAEATGNMLEVIGQLTSAETGQFRSYDGSRLPW
jgi:NAD(P)-dependent dehydrogenase (short-subunit alcohol dehydrogenase family)